jgi:hypothetical protein
MGIKVKLTESQLKRVMILMTEEAAGYDDFHIMMQHGGKSMSLLIDTLSDLLKVFKGISTMVSSDNIEYVDLRENLMAAIDLITEINDVMKIIFKDFTDREVIKSGEIMHRKLESYQEKIRMLINMGEELLSKENLLDKLYNMTENLGEFIVDYSDKLGNADKTFRRRLTKGRDQRNPDFN